MIIDRVVVLVTTLSSSSNIYFQHIFYLFLHSHLYLSFCVSVILHGSFWVIVSFILNRSVVEKKNKFCVRYKTSLSRNPVPKINTVVGQPAVCEPMVIPQYSHCNESILVSHG